MSSALPLNLVPANAARLLTPVAGTSA